MQIYTFYVSNCTYGFMYEKQHTLETIIRIDWPSNARTSKKTKTRLIHIHAVGYSHQMRDNETTTTKLLLIDFKCVRIHICLLITLPHTELAHVNAATAMTMT